jgi:hypothetical protein
MRFKLPDDARQGRPIVVNFGLLHPTLPVGIIKELKDGLKRLVRIVDNIGKPSALAVFEEHITCDCHAWQIGLRHTSSNANKHAKFVPTKFESTYIVTETSKKARSNERRMPLHGLKTVINNSQE